MLYGMDCIPLSSSDISRVNSAKGTVIKNVMGLSKRHHHSQLLIALKIPPMCAKALIIITTSCIMSLPPSKRFKRGSCRTTYLAAILLKEGIQAEDTQLQRVWYAITGQ